MARSAMSAAGPAVTRTSGAARKRYHGENSRASATASGTSRRAPRKAREKKMALAPALPRELFRIVP